jgi:late competence protein required for DNA uptake (superfamily II DNA/RNA helicase)
MSVPLKAVQAECRRCEKLFCYFQKCAARIYCAPCVELERLETLEFTRAQRRKQTAARIYENRQTGNLSRRFRGGLSF